MPPRMRPCIVFLTLALATVLLLACPAHAQWCGSSCYSPCSIVMVDSCGWCCPASCLPSVRYIVADGCSSSCYADSYTTCGAVVDATTCCDVVEESAVEQPPSARPEPAMPKAERPATQTEPAETPADLAPPPMEDLEPATPPAEPSDLFGEPAAEPAALEETPAGEMPAETQPAGGGEAAPAEPSATDTPAGDEDTNLEDLFGEPNESAEPAEGAAPETPPQDGSAESDGLFGAAPGQDWELAVRHWVDNTGRYETNGRLVSIGESHVRLLKENGRYCRVPYHRLGAGERLYVQRVVAQLGFPELRLAGNF